MSHGFKVKQLPTTSAIEIHSSALGLLFGPQIWDLSSFFGLNFDTKEGIFDTELRCGCTSLSVYIYNGKVLEKNSLDQYIMSR